MRYTDIKLASFPGSLSLRIFTNVQYSSVCPLNLQVHLYSGRVSGRFYHASDVNGRKNFFHMAKL